MSTSNLHNNVNRERRSHLRADATRLRPLLARPLNIDSIVRCVPPRARASYNNSMLAFRCAPPRARASVIWQCREVAVRTYIIIIIKDTGTTLFVTMGG